MIRGKENIQSIKSRLGIYKKASLSNSPFIWVHASSVGEAMIAITLIKELKKRHPSNHFLITTGTLSSANIIKKWLPSGVCHEFTPLDNLLIVGRFLKYWQPILGIFIESELWPSLLQGSSGHCKILLLNARLSDRSFKHWQRYPEIFSLLTSFFSIIAVQSDSDFEKYKSLGSRNLENLGNLKFANQELQVDVSEADRLKKLFKNKKIFVASSTHIEDEEVILDIICRLKEIRAGRGTAKASDIYPIIILRHPERRVEITKNCQRLGLTYSLKSKHKNPDLNNDLYIVDTFGELGLFYTLSEIVFVGGSFKRGGHNLLEPAYFDNVILLGSDMSNWQNIADEMIKNKAALQVKNANELQEQIMFFFDNKNAKIAEEYRRNAKNYISNKEVVLTKYLERVEMFLL